MTSPHDRARAIAITASICDATGRNGWDGTRIRLVQQIIAAALEAERAATTEVCAKVAETCLHDSWGSEPANIVAQAIRRRVG